MENRAANSSISKVLENIGSFADITVGKVNSLQVDENAFDTVEKGTLYI